MGGSAAAGVRGETTKQLVELHTTKKDLSAEPT
jgi:hypothetical protein